MNWRDQIKTSVQKESYIRGTLNITGAKSSKEYRNAYRYLDLMAKGQRSGTKSEKFKPVVEQATKDAVQKARESRTPSVTPTSTASTFRVGDTIGGTVAWDMVYRDYTEQRKITKSVRITSERMARDANERGMDMVIINMYYSDDDYYDDYDEGDDPPEKWWHSYLDS